MPMTVEEIAKKLNISKTRVEQLSNSGIQKFFKSFKAFDRNYYDMFIISHTAIIKDGGDIDIYDYYKMLPYKIKQKIKHDAFKYNEKMPGWDYLGSSIQSRLSKED